MTTFARTAILALGSLIAAGVIAVGAMTVSAPAANAQTEKQIKDGCDAANGDYVTGQDELGNTISWCCYKDNEGKQYCDKFVNGTFSRTEDRQAPPPVAGPANPPANNAPIQTKPPPAAPPRAGPNPVLQPGQAVNIP